MSQTPTQSENEKGEKSLYEQLLDIQKALEKSWGNAKQRAKKGQKDVLNAQAKIEASKKLQELMEAVKTQVDDSVGNLNRTFDDVKERVDGVKKDIDETVDRAKDRVDDFKNDIEVTATAYKKLAEDAAVHAGFHFSLFSRAYLSRLFVSLLFLFFATYLNALSSVCAGYRTPNTITLNNQNQPIEPKQRTLPDLGHDAWAALLNFLGFEEHYVDNFHLPDQFVSFLASCTLFLIVIHPKRFMIIRRLSCIFAALQIMRSYTVIVTSLPDASPTCTSQFGNPSGAYKDEIGEHITCGDMVFSGHTTCLMICAMVFHTYCRDYELKKWIPEYLCRVVRRVVYIAVFVGVLIIIGTRLHYTLDVSIAAYLTFRTWITYHQWAKHDLLKKKIGFMMWLEAEEIMNVDQLAMLVPKQKME